MSTIDVHYPQILDECVTHLLEGTMTFESCLGQYPLYADQLQQDLSIFQATRQLSSPQLSEQSVNAIEARLLAKFNGTPAIASQPQTVLPIRNQPTRVQRMAMPYMRWVAGFAIFFMVLIGAGGGTVMASANSVPGDNLYSVKIAWEQVVIFVASLINELDDVWLRLTQTRADEIIILHNEGRLTPNVLDTFYITAENAVLYATDDTEQAYLMLADEIRPIFDEVILLSASETRRFRILRVLSPEVDINGQLILPAGEELLPQTEEEIPTITPTMEPSATFTLTATFTASPTATQTSTPAEPTLTRTPTPSRTPTPIPSATPTLTFTPLPTATWTPLGIQPRGDGVTVNTDSDNGQQVTSSARPTKPFFTGENEFFVRETERAVELTQTVIAQTPTPDGS